MRELRNTVHFKVVKDTCRGHLAGSLIACLVIFLFNGVVRSYERACEFERNGFRRHRAAFRRVVGAVTVNMPAMVIDGDIGVARKGDNFFALRITLDEGCFRSFEIGGLGQVNAFKVLGVIFSGMWPERPGTFEVAVFRRFYRGVVVMEYGLNDQLSRNFQDASYVNGQVISPKAIRLCCTKSDTDGLAHLSVAPEVLVAVP